MLNIHISTRMSNKCIYTGKFSLNQIKLFFSGPQNPFIGTYFLLVVKYHNPFCGYAISSKIWLYNLPPGLGRQLISSYEVNKGTGMRSSFPSRVAISQVVMTGSIGKGESVSSAKGRGTAFSGKEESRRS